MNAAESVKTVNLARIAVNRWAQNAVEMKNSCGVETEESGAKQERSITEWIGDQGRRLATDKVERRTNKCTSKKKTPEYWASGPQKGEWHKWVGGLANIVGRDDIHPNRHVPPGSEGKPPRQTGSPQPVSGASSYDGQEVRSRSRCRSTTTEP